MNRALAELPAQVGAVSMFSYTAYGLAIRSALPLPELVAGEAGASVDVVVRLGSLGRRPPEIDNREGCFHATSEEAYLFWRGIGTFMVRGGHEIVVEPAPGVEERVLRLFVLGSALGVLLHQRGLLVLHASVVGVSGGAVAFLGGSGWGKSTTAAAMHMRGHGILTDDVAALDVDGMGNPIVLPAFPRLKLCVEAAASLGFDLETLTMFDPEDERREYRVTHGFLQAPLPLKRIYVLDEGMRQEIEPLRPQEAFVELVRHSYAVGHLGAVGATREHFRQCARIADSVSISRLKRQRSVSVLPDVARLVKEHIAHV